MKITKVEIEKVENSNNRLLARANIEFDDCIRITNIKLIEGVKGIFVAMPSYKFGDEYQDICLLLTQELNKEVSNLIIAKYIGGVE